MSERLLYVGPGNYCICLGNERHDPRTESLCSHVTRRIPPRILQGKQGKPPVWAVVLQGGIALFLVFAYQLQTILNNVGAILTFLGVDGLFPVLDTLQTKGGIRHSSLSAPHCRPVLPAPVRVMLYFGFKQSATLNLWVGASILTALIGYFITKRRIDLRNGRIAAQSGNYGS